MCLCRCLCGWCSKHECSVEMRYLFLNECLCHVISLFIFFAVIARDRILQSLTCSSCLCSFSSVYGQDCPKSPAVQDNQFDQSGQIRGSSETDEQFCQAGKVSLHYCAVADFGSSPVPNHDNNLYKSVGYCASWVVGLEVGRK